MISFLIMGSEMDNHIQLKKTPPPAKEQTAEDGAIYINKV